MARGVRIYIKEDYDYSREWFFQPTDEEFIEKIKDFVENHKDEYGEDFTPENLLLVFKRESNLFDIELLMEELNSDYGGNYEFFGEPHEIYGDVIDCKIECDPKVAENCFRMKR